VADNRGMVILQVFIQVKAEHVEAFKLATIENARNSAKEPGIARFDFLQQEDDPARFMLSEVYRDAEAVVAHKETPHYLKWSEQTADMFAVPRSRTRYVNVFPGDQVW
jgi:autoinducer 2-degrading protein